ncbi:MAG TPA: sigma-70 family RNA polymerase sigma factor [Planctomycetota bacterium]|nr:sigma-70 family RNA polymerase sigma factor [Planctomycetota bacterium]
MTDSEWVRAAVAQYEGPLLRYALRISGDLETARDIVQDTFLKLCRAERPEVEAHLAQWLYTVCRNRALDLVRKEGRMNHVHTEVADMPDGRDALPAAPVERAEALGRVLALLATLPPRQQEVIRLKFQEGLSYKEIAGITQLTANHVGVIIHEGIKSLRARLGASPRVAREA